MVVGGLWWDGGGLMGGCVGLLPWRKVDVVVMFTARMLGARNYGMGRSAQLYLWSN